MADIQPGSVLTPNKTQTLSDTISTELNNLNNLLSFGQIGTAQKKLATDSKNQLQGLLNNLLQKKGVVTPDETDAALNAIDAAKKAQLKSDFVLGIKKSTIFLFVIVGAGVGAFLYFKNKK